MGNFYTQIHLLKYDYFSYERTLYREISYKKLWGLWNYIRSNEILLHWDTLKISKCTCKNPKTIQNCHIYFAWKLVTFSVQLILVVISQLILYWLQCLISTKWQRRHAMLDGCVTVMSFLSQLRLLPRHRGSHHCKIPCDLCETMASLSTQKLSNSI